MTTNPTTPHPYTQEEEREAERLAIAAGFGVSEWEGFLSMAKANLATPHPAAEQATLDVEEIAFQEAMAAWDAKPARERRILSPSRHFFHSGYDAARATHSEAVDMLESALSCALDATFALSVKSQVPRPRE